MKKIPHCTRCGQDGHYAISCRNKPIKPIKPIKRTPIKKTTKPKKKKKSERAIAKDKAWDSFSIYIRTRDCLRFTGDPTQGKCITCNKPFDFKHLQAGHFINGRGNAVLFDERLVYSQCLTSESNIRLFNGKNKSIAKLKVGDELWSFDEDVYSLEKSFVEKIESFIPEKLYMVEMENGNVFYATGDHMVVANNEWVSIRDILHDVLAYDILEI